MTRRVQVVPAILMVALIGSACAQDSDPEDQSESTMVRDVTSDGPSETTGVFTNVRGAIELAGYSDALLEGSLRVREVTVEPGGRIAVHAHDERPAVVYVVEGELVEHRSDSPGPIVRGQDDVYLEGPGVVHWLENVAQQPARAITVDIFPPERP